ncbi:MAG: DUF6377 domain-containing protein [Paludibacteraceae bacterium]|nr:DUF6377 domain-containing protein [Paludibacteraceae bacterium]
MKHSPLRYVCLAIALCCLGIGLAEAGQRSVVDSLLRVLDKELTHSEQYLAQRVEQIDGLKATYYEHPTTETAYSIAELYAPYLCDSALRYYQLAQVLCPGEIPHHIEVGLENCRTRMYGGESVYELHYTDGVPPLDTHEYAIYAYRRSDAARYAGENEEQEEWLIRSAIADVRSGVTDNASSWMLAEIVYNNGEGDIERAYKYVQYSLNNAAIFDARMRFMQINQVSQIINRAYEQQQQQASQRLHIFLIILLIVLLLMVVLAMVVVRQNRRLHSLNHKMKAVNNSLHEANNIKERYISLYLVACADNLRRMAKMAPKATGQTSAQFMEAEMPAFYQRFDTSFLSIYPDFVEEFNALLRPEERIYPEKEGALNTELRIFALIRLGIDSSTRIAELLCYSTNTIYNYRARVKNHALDDREGFEDRVRRIGTFTE